MTTRTVDLTSSQTLRGLAKDLHDPIKAAAELGWTGRTTGKAGLLLYSPNGTNVVKIPAQTNLNKTQVRQIVRDLIRYSPAMDAANRFLDDADQASLTHALGGEASLTPILAAVDTAGGAFGSAVAAALVKEDHSQDEPTPVKEAPWLARVSSDGSRADLYPSKAVIHRTWSDGTEDYLCAEPGCDYVRPKARSVVSHFANVHSRGKGTQDINPPVVFDTPIDGPNTRRVAGLAREIEAALHAVGEVSDRTELARRMAEHIIEARVAAGREKADAEPEPASAEEIVERMRSLLLRDDARQVAVLEREVALLTARIEGAAVGYTASMEAMQAERDAALALAARRKAALDTLADLAREEEDKA